MDMIRYRTKAAAADANEKLIRAVYAELRETQPDDLRYAAFRMADQVTFVHLVESEGSSSPLLAVKAFGEFQAGAGERFETAPVRETFTEVGSYRFF
ncbi:MAG TPA: hypothetical protein VGG16_06325 [Streptosporangiaceae bacterium]|jgi:hypothetical protein